MPNGSSSKSSTGARTPGCPFTRTRTCGAEPPDGGRDRPRRPNGVVGHAPVRGELLLELVLHGPVRALVDDVGLAARRRVEQSLPARLVAVEVGAQRPPA